MIIKNDALVPSFLLKFILRSLEVIGGHIRAFIIQNLVFQNKKLLQKTAF